MENSRYRCNHISDKDSQVCRKKVWGSYFCDEHLRGHPDNDEIPSPKVEYQCRDRVNKRKSCRRRCRKVVVGSFLCRRH
jgi:hypothetical protein